MKHKLRDRKRAKRERPIVVPMFGSQLRELRGKRSRGAMCNDLTTFGLRLDRSTLLQYERGTVGSPDPAVLWGLGRLYHVSLDDLVLALMRDRTGRPVIARDLRPPALDEEQTRVATYFGQYDDATRKALATIMENLMPRVPPQRARLIGPRSAARVVKLEPAPIDAGDLESLVDRVRERLSTDPSYVETTKEGLDLLDQRETPAAHPQKRQRIASRRSV